jgi:hypothetical protein
LHWLSADSYVSFMAIDYITLLLAMLCGSWYGIWLGDYWYSLVYEQGKWRGAFRHFQHKYFLQKSNYADLKAKVEAVAERLGEDLSQVEDLAKEIPKEILSPASIKRRAVKKKPAASRVKAAE